jgi:predicted acylesterase/phospholipase RssA
MKLLALGGGGCRALATIGALMAAQRQGIDCVKHFDALCGDSSGALLALMLAAGWPPARIMDAILHLGIDKLLSPLPWPVRLPMAVAKPIPLAPLARWIDEQGLVPLHPLVINTWDSDTNTQLLITNSPALAAHYQGHTTPALLKSQWLVLPPNASAMPTWGQAVCRSMALPGLLADHPRWMDGALGEHPPLSFAAPTDKVVIVNLGYPGLVPHPTQNGHGMVSTIPQGTLARALYAYEVTASINQQRSFARFTTPVVQIEPRVFDVPSTAFNLSPKQKLALMRRGYEATLPQWPAVHHTLYTQG